MASICAIQPPRGASFSPKLCPNQTSSESCTTDRDTISACAITLGTSTDDIDGTPTPYTRRRELVRALDGHALAVAGDSMARQAFAVLVARLRGEAAVVDFNAHAEVHYTLHLSGARAADALELPHLSNPLLDAHGGRIDKWARARVDHTAESSRVSTSHADFYWAPCGYNMQDAAGSVHASRRGPYDRVVLFAPAYWHLTGACGKSLKRMLNATPTAIDALWRPWVAQSHTRPHVRYTLITPPTEKVPHALVGRQRTLNDALIKRFASGAFPRNWELFDWAALMELRRPPTIVPHGDQKASWHYACQLYRQINWYSLSRNHTPNVMTRPLGDCREDGSTPLWEAVLLDMPPELLTRSTSFNSSGGVRVDGITSGWNTSSLSRGGGRYGSVHGGHTRGRHDRTLAGTRA